MSCVKHLRFAVACLSCWGVLACTLAFSQTRRSEPRQYQPARETLSPYVGLLQGNNGVIPNYYSLVRPRLEQRTFNQQLQATTRVQSLNIQALSGSTESSPRPLQTGKSAGFEQYLNYYPTLPVTIRRP
jgi:hypothetical protein